MRQALHLRDLTDPDDGPHAMQILIPDTLWALQEAWHCEIKLYRENPIVPEACNEYRDAIYARLHQGTVWQWAAKT